MDVGTESKLDFEREVRLFFRKRKLHVGICAPLKIRNAKHLRTSARSCKGDRLDLREAQLALVGLFDVRAQVTRFSQCRADLSKQSYSLLAPVMLCWISLNHLYSFSSTFLFWCQINPFISLKSHHRQKCTARTAIMKKKRVFCFGYKSREDYFSICFSARRNFFFCACL